MEANLKYIENVIENAHYSNKERALKQFDEIITKMPYEIQELIGQAFKHKLIPKEYLFSSILFAFSNAAGLAFAIQSQNYTNYANLYFAIVGDRGDAKSPAMVLATQPLEEKDNETYRDDIMRKLENSEENTPRKRLLVQDATIESAQFDHHLNKYSIGIFIDELYQLIQKMGSKSSNEGTAWRTFFLQGSTNKPIDISRKTTKSYRIEKSYPTLMGSIQTHFIPELFGNGNLESGLIDRLLFTTKLTSNTTLSKETMPKVAAEMYATLLLNVLNYRNDIEEAQEMDCITLLLTDEAKNGMHEYSQKLLDKKEKLSDYTKEYTAKMLISIHKFTLLVHLIQNAGTNNYKQPITLDTVELAILISDYYLTHFKIILQETNSKSEKEPSLDDIIKFAIKNKAQQKDVVTISGKDKGTVSRHWKKIVSSMQPATSI